MLRLVRKISIMVYLLRKIESICRVKTLSNSTFLTGRQAMENSPLEELYIFPARRYYRGQGCRAGRGHWEAMIWRK
jgi:hypothetical protein